jgi:hypothetical protein
MDEPEVNLKEEGMNIKQVSIVVLCFVVIVFLYFGYKSSTKSFKELYVEDKLDTPKEIMVDSEPENLLKEISKYSEINIPNIVSEQVIDEKDFPAKFSYILNTNKDEKVVLKAVEFSEGYSGFKVDFITNGLVQDVYKSLRGQLSYNSKVIFGSNSVIAGVIDFEGEGHIGRVELLKQEPDKTLVRVFLIIQKS